MNEEVIENKMIRYRSAILLILFIVIFLLFFIFLVSIGKTIGSDRNTDNKFVTLENKAIRGKIISADNFVVAYSRKQFRAEVNTLSIDPKKRTLFVKLFSIYSGMSEEEILSKFVNKEGRTIRGRIVLTDDLDYRLAYDLKSLSYKMARLHIFRPLNPRKPHLIYALDILPSSETRYFPHKNLLTPVVGYMRTIDQHNYKQPIAKKGLEKKYSDYLEADTNGMIKAKRDILGTPIKAGEITEKARVDGMDLHLNIALSFQRDVEKVLDDMKQQTAAEEIMASVMDSQTGEILALATSERFNPKHIRQKDVKSLNPNFAEYLYEPGSVMKPLTMAIALEHNKINLSSPILLGGTLRVNKGYTIHDDDYFKSLTPKGIIMFSSNIGISKIAWRLSGKELHDGWKNFGLSRPSGIDLSKELKGRIKSAGYLNHKVHAANTAYGYGMFANFMQLLKAYSAFNNDGIAVTPQIVSYMSDQSHRRYKLNAEVNALQACSAKTANSVKEMLHATVERGTGTAAQYDGLEVGGKTGTAHIVSKGHYVEEYHSSFYGFVNDKRGHKYTIGVLAIKPKKVYFASQTAAPTFQKIIGKMVKHKYLSVDPILARLDLHKREALRKRKHNAYVRKIQAYNKAHGIK